jgi:hypothetical protein
MSQNFRLVTTPIDTRVYVSPFGERCRLMVARVGGPWPEPWWAIELLNDQDVSPIAGVMAIVHVKDREQARAIYRERLVALKTAGWRRA